MSQNIPDTDFAIPANRTLAIFLVSIWALFLEMLLIRWVGTEIRIFAYLQNTVLVVCFLGLGLGCMSSNRPIEMRRGLVPLVILTLLLAIPYTHFILFRISDMLSVLHDSDSLMWTTPSSTSFWETALMLALGGGLTLVLMLLMFDMFIPIGRILGRLMDNHPNTNWAYSVNIAGSLAGTWLFVLLSYFYQPPVTWAIVVAGLMIAFMARRGPKLITGVALLGVFVAGAWLAGQQEDCTKVVWSPYQKLALQKVSLKGEDCIYQINVNNVGYQAMFNFKRSFTSRYPSKYDPELYGYSQYDIPFLLNPNPGKVLIVGAGSGNDAAGALRNGVKDVTAVDIDPAIISFGREYHPEDPYASQAVCVVNDDARSFMATCDKKYDTIIFGLLDSHTTTAMTNARLDNYVYTRESIRRASELLAEDGVMVISFEVRRPYIGRRLAGLLNETFGEPPISFRIPDNNYGFGGMMFIAGNMATVRDNIAGNARLSELLDKWRKESHAYVEAGSTRLTDDDWPYLYIESPSIPTLYYFLALLMCLLVVRGMKRTGNWETIKGLGRSHWHFFFLGAAFLLLEVQNISKASVVLGNTWDVNAVIVSGVLVMILLANLLAYKIPSIPILAIYALLFVSCVSLYFIDLASFAFLPYATKAMVVGGLTTLPVFFGGLVFIRSFEVVSGKDKALGANLIGAVFGAMLQALTFVVGIKALLIVVTGFYILAMLTRPSAGSAEAEPA